MFRSNLFIFIFIIMFMSFLNACGGGGGNESVTTSPSSSVPTATSCVNPHSSDYPDEYLGQFELPSPRGELASHIVRGISFKDYSPSWIYEGLLPPYRGDCSKDEYIKLMYVEALKAMQASGVQRAWVYNFGDWNNNQEPWVVRLADYHIPQKYVEYIVEQAGLLGIDIYFAWQFTQTNINRQVIVELGEQVTMAKLKSILDAHHNNMLTQATYAQEIGIKGIAADWNAMNINLSTDQLKDYYIERFAEIIDDIRANFDGEIVWGQIGYVFNDERIFSRVDSILVNAMNAGGSTQFTQEENANLTPELIKEKTLTSLENMRTQIYCLDIHQPCWHGKSDIELPVILNIQVQSREDFFLTGWKEDGFCTNATLENGTVDPCIQESFVTDFSVQAIGIEGIMQALADQDSFEIGSVDINTGYWLSDTLTPSSEGFPNISQSVRGKPAESVVKYWYTGNN
ncbi:hypothetical protein [uncultured Paraglaciecola sp.]|uniref:hypothetical protein n=1 Tax=uncultured Paraglaciecola sp. TaxID=1765024 RepID=UPI0025F44605|nr:hypothetical protein [uncultured Paraglaciecola sp.]